MQLNHNLILASDLVEMSRFWTQAIGLTIGKRPPFSSKGLWFYSDDKALIHVELKKTIIHHHNVINHLALEGADYESLIEKIKKEKYPYTQNVMPLTNERQVFVSGPDGLKVEMLFPMRSASI